MRTASQRFLSLLLVLTVSFPTTAGAAASTEVLKTPDAQSVTRGDFIRAAVSVLGIPLKTTGTLPYTRPVPKNLQPPIRTALSLGALEMFGKDLSPAKSITRGEALQVLMHLTSLKPEGTATTFSDVKKGSDAADAVQLAIEKKWMEPQSSTLFGIARALSGLEGRDLLRKVSGQTSSDKPTITLEVVKFKKDALSIPGEDLLKNVWQILNNQYLYKDKISQQEAAYKAAEAIVESVGDPYTVFMRPVSAKEFQDQLSGEVSGIGAQVEYKDNALVVVSPLAGSPAEKAGLKSGDRILSVDGVSLAGLNFLEAVNKVRGPKGTSAKLHIKRDTSDFDVTVTRDVIKVPEIQISYQGAIAIVKLTQFGQSTDTELRGLLQEVEKHNVNGLVLDLRNNPGGLLHAAEIVLSNFLPKGSGVAHIMGKNEDFLEVTADAPTINANTPMVVLVNKGSASASEIVAGALQDAKRATILGEKTFGKGTVQQILEFRDGSSIKMTIAEWLTPKKRKINGEGVTPDIIVTQTETKDEQLLRAIDLLP